MVSCKKFKLSDLKVITHNHQYEYKNWIFFADDWTHALQRAKERYKDLCKLAMGVDPTKQIDKPLWVVSGPSCFPQLTLVTIKNHPTCGLTVWGWSIYRRCRGFRTIGLSLSAYIGQNENAKFYLNRQHAFDRLADLIPEVP